MEEAVKGLKPKGGLRPIGVNRHMSKSSNIRQVLVVTRPDTLFMSLPGLCEPLGVNLCI